MAKKIPHTESEEERMSKWLGTLKYKDLKKAAIMRGFPFNLIGNYGVHELQSWLYQNYKNDIKPQLLQEYDKWVDESLMSQGYIDEPIHIDLKLGDYAVDEDGNEIRRKRNVALMGAIKTPEEKAAFIPKKGSKKQRVYQLVEQELDTQEIITKMDEEFGNINDGSIKSWCSRARKQIALKKELNDKTK